MRALVTGGTGFIGSRLVRHLLARGDYVRVLARPHGIGEATSPRPNGPHWIEGDVLDRPSIINAAEGCDVMFHLAALTEAGYPADDYFRTNIQGTENVIQACDHANVHILVHVSAADVVVEDCNPGGDEDTLAYPDHYPNPYAESKAVSEQMVLAAHGAGQVVATVVRPCWAWGPGDSPTLRPLLRLAAAGWFAWVDSGTANIMPAHVDNVVHGLVLAAERPQSVGETFFLGDGTPRPVKQFLTGLLAAYGIERSWRSIPSHAAFLCAGLVEGGHRLLAFPGPPPLTRRTVDLVRRDQVYPCAKAERLLGYQPQTTLEEGLRALSEWVVAEGGAANILHRVERIAREYR